MPEYLNSRPNWSGVDVSAADAAEVAGEAAVDAASEAANDSSWGTTEVVLAAGAVITLLVVVYLVYAEAGSSGAEAKDSEQNSQDPYGVHDAKSGDTFARVERQGLVQR